MKQNFRGWTTVYGFTFRQATKGKGFKVVTALVAILIIGIIIIANIITAKPEDENKPEISPVKTVFILDNSGLAPTDFKNLNPEFSTEQFQSITFSQVTAQTRDEVIKAAAADSDASIAVIISSTNKGYEMETAIPSGSIISRGQAQAVLNRMSAAFETSKLMQSGLTEDQLQAALMPSVTSYADIGENTSTAVFLIKMIAPMIFSFILYFMLLLHGQTVSKSVSNEKTSKLMETLLTSVHPYALISGKILAVTTMAMLQFVIWIAAVIAGLYGGNMIAQSIYPDFQNSVIAIIDFLRDNIGASAMSPAAVILCIIFFSTGFLFFCVMAGLAGCMVSKPEDVASTQSLFIFPVVISWVISYVAPLSGNHQLMNIIRFIPFTAPFSVPVDLITGTVSPLMGVLQLAVLILFTFLFILLSGRIYKGLILYSGQKPSLKMIGNIIKADR